MNVELHSDTSLQSSETLSRESNWAVTVAAAATYLLYSCFSPSHPQFLPQSITPIFLLLCSPGPRGHLDLSTDLLCLSRILHAPPKGRTLLSHFYRAPGCNFRYPSVLNLADASQIWTLPLESTLSRRGKAAASSPRVSCPSLCFLLVQSFGISGMSNGYTALNFTCESIHPSLASQPIFIECFLHTSKLLSSVDAMLSRNILPVPIRHIF